METVGERVRLMRKQLDMTQEQMAQRLGIGKAALSMIETGKARLSARNKNILVLAHKAYVALVLRLLHILNGDILLAVDVYRE